MFVFVRLAEGVPFSTLVNQFSQLPVSVAFSENSVTTAGFLQFNKELVYMFAISSEKSTAFSANRLSFEKKTNTNCKLQTHTHAAAHVYCANKFVNEIRSVQIYKFFFYTPPVFHLNIFDKHLS